MGERSRIIRFSLFHFRYGNQKVFGKGPIGKFFSGEDAIKEIMKICKAEIGDRLLCHVAKKMKLKKFFL